MNTARDNLLEALVKIAEDRSPATPHDALHVTLLVGGTLVTGRIISHDEFVRQHPFLEKLWEKYPRPLSELPPQQRITGEGERWCIHLADARFAVPGQPAPSGPGVYWRGRLAEVVGFSFAKPAAAPQPGRTAAS
jgi:hypothetical protein